MSWRLLSLTPEQIIQILLIFVVILSVHMLHFLGSRVTRSDILLSVIMQAIMLSVVILSVVSLTVTAFFFISCDEV